MSLIFAAKTEALELVMLQLPEQALGRHSGTAAHNRWLRTQLPGIRALPNGQRRFPWGTIAADWIEQNAECTVIASYREPAAPFIRKDAG